MRKIPTIFIRDHAAGRARLLEDRNPACSWVFAGEGVATAKLDGTSCMIKDGKLFKRRELKPGATSPGNMIVVDMDDETGKAVGWIPVGDGPQDQWHREAFDRGLVWSDGTYELLGPKVQGNPEKKDRHVLVPHSVELLGLEDGPLEVVPVDFNGLRNYLTGKDIEGIVWHHPDGRMAKIKLRDFGLKRGGQE